MADNTPLVVENSTATLSPSQDETGSSETHLATDGRSPRVGRKKSGGAPGKRKRAQKANPDSPPRALTAQEEEAMSTALIAKLLQQDDASYYGNSYGTGGAASYYAEYDHTGQYSSRGHQDHPNGYLDEDGDSDYQDEDDDYRPNRNKGGRPTKRSQGGAGNSRNKRRKSAGSDQARKVATNAAETLLTIATDTSRSDLPPPSTVNPDDPPSAESRTPAKAKPKPVKKSKDSPSVASNTGFRTGAYLEDERQRFLEALERYGRSWKQVVAHVGTRDEKSIRSHAQKHFIKLFRDNLPLPAKVQESGTGYTLSGLPLDPNSASARVYLGKKTQPLRPPTASAKSSQPTSPVVSTPVSTDQNCERPSTMANGDVQQSPCPIQTETSNATPVETTKPAPPSLTDPSKVETLTTESSPVTPKFVSAEELNRMGAKPSSGENTPSPKTAPPTTKSLRPPTTTSTKPLLSSPRKKPTATAPVKQTTPHSKSTGATPGAVSTTQGPSAVISPVSPATRSDYAKSRLRSAPVRTARLNRLADDTDPLSLVKCTRFSGTPASGQPGSQPFAMQVCSNAFLGMDFHAHLMESEIIGFLAGRWDPETRQLVVQYAFPCRALRTPGQNASVNVEMDPTSEFEVRQAILDRDLQVVGWYHSHPCFLPDPSLVDLENQCNYQSLFANQTTRAEPFVGAIVGPYDPNLPGLVSVVNWFYVDRERAHSLAGGYGSRQAGKPVAMAQVSDPSLVAKRLVFEYSQDEEIPRWQADLWLQLPERYQLEPMRAHLNERWKIGSGETRLQKLLVSLAFRMPWLHAKLYQQWVAKEAGKESPDSNTVGPVEHDNSVKSEPLSNVTQPTPADHIEPAAEDTKSLYSGLATAEKSQGTEAAIPPELNQDPPPPMTETTGTSPTDENPTAETSTAATLTNSNEPKSNDEPQDPLSLFTSAESYKLMPTPKMIDDDYFLHKVLHSLKDW
ncbi:hypothetical protein IWQ62_004661 [Dispira parvispora]|uniref:MPN domain-containing protein n=1 Tax=Dispira parvispora TaxID=1520584 RepID=A0A9W8E1S0_9FUNG|nr:hypothetical protein IWQ62_004661 [Dispira parvispora]